MAGHPFELTEAEDHGTGEASSLMDDPNNYNLIAKNAKNNTEGID